MLLCQPCAPKFKSHADSVSPDLTVINFLKRPLHWSRLILSALRTTFVWSLIAYNQTPYFLPRYVFVNAYYIIVSNLDTFERMVSLYYVITYCIIMYHRGEYTKHVDPIRTTCEKLWYVYWRHYGVGNGAPRAKTMAPHPPTLLQLSTHPTR